MRDGRGLGRWCDVATAHRMQENREDSPGGQDTERERESDGCYENEARQHVSSLSLSADSAPAGTRLQITLVPAPGMWMRKVAGKSTLSAFDPSK